MIPATPGTTQTTGSKTVISVVDCCGANISSVVYALRRLGVEAQLTSDKAVVAASDHVILPGVGAFDRCATALADNDLTDTVKALTVPVLGICVGMQLLYEGSAEGELPGLGLITGTVARVPGGKDLTVPHMGWNQVAATVGDDPLVIAGHDEWYYFTHSYFAPPSDAATGVTHYGVEITATCRRDNFHGVQFHPERSATAGATLLKNFLTL